MSSKEYRAFVLYLKMTKQSAKRNEISCSANRETLKLCLVFMTSPLGVRIATIRN